MVPYYFAIAETADGKVWEDLLRSQLLNEPAITTPLLDLLVSFDAGTFRVSYPTALSGAEQAALTALAAAHQGDLQPAAPPGAVNVTCPVGVAVGDAVYTSGSNSVDKATALDVNKAAIGLVLSKPSATTAIVVDSGELPVFVGLVAGQSYFLDTVAGGIVAGAPPSGVFVQRLGYAKNATTLKAQVV